MSCSASLDLLLVIILLSCCCWWCKKFGSVVAHEEGGGGGVGKGGNEAEYDEAHRVYIAGFFPTSAHVAASKIGLGVLPAVRLALQHINDNPRILKGYYLQIIYNDTACDAAVGMKAFFDMVYRKPQKLILFGAACTQVTDPVAKTARVWHLAQLSYADTHPMFSSQNYPNFFRIVPSEIDFNPPRVHLLKVFNWTQVGTLYQNAPRYSLAHNKLVNELEKAGINIIDSQSFAKEAQSHLVKLKDKNVRIILGNFNETWARNIFCEAYKLRMFGRKYQWIIVGMYEERWWEQRDSAVNCHRWELLMALEGMIATDLLPLRSNDIRTVSDQTPKKYNEEYNRMRGSEYSRFHGYAYDGVWATALAINAVMKKLNESHETLTLHDDFRYRDPFWGRLFHVALNATTFEGVTGTVQFYNNDRKGLIMLKQFQGTREVKIGEFNGMKMTLDFKTGEAIYWRGGRPPLDRTLTIIERMRVNLTIYAVLTIIASVGIIVAFTFLVINLRFRNQRNIKMSSPYLNSLIIIGCILTYTSVILLGLDSELTSEESLPFICSVRAWILMSGFTLAFGSMFSKTWRVHTIFTDIKLNKKAITDYQLFAVVAVLLAIDIAIMTTWQTVDPFYRETKKLPPINHPTNQDFQVVPEMEYCKSNQMTIFLGAIYLYKGLLMVIGCFLAWETRHVSIPALNDSKYIGMSVYNVVIMCVIGAAISFVLADQQNASFIIISVFIIFCTTTTLCLVFVPKLIDLRRNPQGTDSRVRITLQPSTRRRRRSSEEDVLEKIRLIHEENQLIRKTLREKDIVIRSLIRQLGDDVGDFIQDSRKRYPRVVEIIKKAGSSSMDDDDLSINSSQDSEIPLASGDNTNKERQRVQYLVIHNYTPQSDRRSISTVELDLSSGTGTGRDSPATLNEGEAIPMTELTPQLDARRRSSSCNNNFSPHQPAECEVTCAAADHSKDDSGGD